MKVLIVESNPDLGGLWKSHLERLGASKVGLALSEKGALHEIMRGAWDVIVLNLSFESGAAMSVADYASYRLPSAKIIIINSTSFFSDGSIFNHFVNAQTSLPESTKPEDLAATVVHYSQSVD